MDSWNADVRDRPNILFVVADDQGPWALGAAGNDEIHTPCLDELAARGTRFTDFYCASPVCSPARASMLTGQMPGRHGVLDWITASPDTPPERYLDGQETFVQHLVRGGYRAGHFGKWHLGDASEPSLGFERWVALQESHGRYVDAPFISDRPGDDCGGYVSDVIARHAAAFVGEDDPRPFFASMQFTAPHHPWVGQHPQRVLDLYEECSFDSCPQDPHSSLLHPSMAPAVRQALADPRPSLIGYFAAVTAMDEAIGAVLEAIEDAQLANDTAVVFTSDNGYSCGQDGIWGKGNATWPLNLSENSVKVPTIVDCPPRFGEGHVCRRPASHYDLWPTILGIGGVGPAGQDGPGRDLAHTADQCSGEQDRVISVYDEYGAARMIRKGRHKLVHRWPDGPHELYDLTADPRERNNLWHAQSHIDERRELQEELESWFARYAETPWDARRLGVTGAGQGARLEPGQIHP